MLLLAYCWLTCCCTWPGQGACYTVGCDSHFTASNPPLRYQTPCRGAITSGPTQGVSLGVYSNLTSLPFCCMQLEAPPVDQAEYNAYRTATDLREPYRWIKLVSWPSASCPPYKAIPVPVTEIPVRLWLAWCRVPLSYLRDTKKFVVPDLPEAPLIVFINSRSGGRAGPALTETLFHALGHSQVWLFWWQFLLWCSISP